jgi:hypothetical protein
MQSRYPLIRADPAIRDSEYKYPKSEWKKKKGGLFTKSFHIRERERERQRESDRFTIHTAIGH